MNKPELQNRVPAFFIGGQWRDASDGEFFTTKCPANGEKLAECAQATKEDVMMLSGKHGKHLKPGRRFLPVNALPF